MRVQSWKLGLGAVALLGFWPGPGSLRAQDAASEQNLTVWVVRPATSTDHAVRRAQQDIESMKQYRETTAGSFGKSASETGQTAGSYGKPASEEGRPASEVGQTASSYGQTASSLPSNVKSQTAGSYGQTAGSFGTSASDYTGAPRPVAATEGTSSRDSKGSRWTNFLNDFQDHRSVQVHVLEIHEFELQDRLTANEGRGNFPDVILADRMPAWWLPVERQMTVLQLADLPSLQVFPDETAKPRQLPNGNPYLRAYGMVQAPHPEATREFLEWWFARARFSPIAGPPPEKPSRVASLAREATLALFNGGSLDAIADPAMARFNGSVTLSALLGGIDGKAPPDLRVDVAVSSGQANSRFAVFQLHAVCVSRSVYGEFFPLVLLRTNSRGEWRVLQITVGISPQDAGRVRDLLQPYAMASKQLIPVDAPVLASPLNGDQRAPGSGLRLAWDASAEDGLMLVEWQLGRGENAMASSVMVVSNQEGRMHTEAAAPFASLGGPVRWRVWALGHGGTVQMSDWRTVEMR